MAQPGDRHDMSMSDKEPRVPISELRATIAQMLKEASGDHKADRGNRRVLTTKVDFIDMSLGQPNMSLR